MHSVRPKRAAMCSGCSSSGLQTTSTSCGARCRRRRRQGAQPALQQRCAAVAPSGLRGACAMAPARISATTQSRPPFAWQCSAATSSGVRPSPERRSMCWRCVVVRRCCKIAGEPCAAATCSHDQFRAALPSGTNSCGGSRGMPLSTKYLESSESSAASNGGRRDNNNFDGNGSSVGGGATRSSMAATAAARPAIRSARRHADPSGHADDGSAHYRQSLAG